MWLLRERWLFLHSLHSSCTCLLIALVANGFPSEGDSSSFPDSRELIWRTQNGFVACGVKLPELPHPVYKQDITLWDWERKRICLICGYQSFVLRELSAWHIWDIWHSRCMGSWKSHFQEECSQGSESTGRWNVSFTSILKPWISVRNARGTPLTIKAYLVLQSS